MKLFKHDVRVPHAGGRDFLAAPLVLGNFDRILSFDRSWYLL